MKTIKSRSTTSRKRKLPSAFPPRVKINTDKANKSLVNHKDDWYFDRLSYRRLEDQMKQKRDAKREVKKLEKKVEQLQATINFLLTL